MYQALLSLILKKCNANMCTKSVPLSFAFVTLLNFVLNIQFVDMYTYHKYAYQLRFIPAQGMVDNNLGLVQRL